MHTQHLQKALLYLSKYIRQKKNEDKYKNEHARATKAEEN